MLFLGVSCASDSLIFVGRKISISGRSVILVDINCHFGDKKRRQGFGGARTNSTILLIEFAITGLPGKQPKGLRIYRYTSYCVPGSRHFGMLSAGLCIAPVVLANNPSQFLDTS
jgi:hypothetical protein